MITIKTLGPASITVDGAPPPPDLLWRKHLALLIYLARSPRGTRTRDHLLGLLWQDRPGPAARHSLNEALRIVRRAVGDGGLTTTVDQVSLAPEAVALDVDQLTAALAGGDTARAAALIEGDFLEGFAIPDGSEFEDWLAAERRHWRTRSIETLVRHADQLARTGNPGDAARTAERAVRLDSESEPAVRALIEALVRSGDPAGATASYRRFVAATAERSGGVPSRELQALAERITRAAIRPKDAVRGPPAPTQRRAPLVGRAGATAALERIWRLVAAGRAAGGFILGDSGLGKSRLLEELRAVVAIEGGSMLVVRLVETDREEPWAALTALARAGLARVPGVAGAGSGALAALAGAFPEWADRFPGVRADAAIGLPEAVLDIVAAATGEGPLVVAIDDAQWSDRGSTAWFESALRTCADRPFGVIWSAQSYPGRDELDRVRSRIGRDLPGSVITLAPLGHGEIEALAAWTFPRYDRLSLERITRRIEQDTGGYPLFVIDLLGAIAAGIDLGDSRPWLKPAATLSQTLPGELPDSVVAAIRVGFRHLSADAQASAAAAAIGPDRIDPDRLRRVTALPPDRFDQALDELEWTRWFAADAAGYTFVAGLVRKVVARDFVTARQRRQWEARSVDPPPP